MQIDWDKTIEEILAEKAVCARCGEFTEEIVVGFTREPWGAEYAPRCQFCTRKDDCDARKLVVVCESCARDLRLRAKHVDHETMMGMLMTECRKDLEDSLEYLSEFWQEDLDVSPDDSGKRLEEYSPDVFTEENEARRRLEEEYLTYHRWLRERALRVPDPGWRGEYVEGLIALGYETLLGD